MAMDPTGPPPEGPINPYAAPEASLSGAPLPASADLAEAEATRRKYIGHEVSVKSIGSLHYLGAFFALLGAVALGMVGFSTGPQAAGGARGVLFGVVALYLVIGAVNVALGIGLTRLRTWARWVETVLVGLYTVINVLGMVVALLFASQPGAIAPALIGNGFGLLILSYILYLLLSPKGAVVFSPEYQEVIARTPHVKYKTSCIVKFFLLLIVAVLVLAVVGAILGIRR